MTDNFKYVGKQLGVIVLVVLAALLVFIIGLMIGYSVIGNGSDVWSILSPKTWNEVINKLTGKG